MGEGEGLSSVEKRENDINSEGVSALSCVNTSYSVSGAMPLRSYHSYYSCLDASSKSDRNGIIRLVKLRADELVRTRVLA